MKTNHWGCTVDSEIAITGVVSNNSLEWLYEEIDKGINLTYEEYKDSFEYDHELSDEENESLLDEYLEQFESMGDDTILIGDWIKGDDGLYDYDPSGEYAAIVRESVTQVIFSHNFKHCALCSPCYPGQGDLDSEGDYLCYDLPDDIYGSYREK